jgi:hypothetical protein
VIEFGPCAGDGRREIRLISELSVSRPGDLVQWFVDGRAFSPVVPPGLHLGLVLGDGQPHQIELRVVSPRGVPSDVERVVFPACEPVRGHIRAIDFGACDDEGLRPIRLTSDVRPAGTESAVQWLIDGRPVGDPVPPGVFVSSIRADGSDHQVELVVVRPEGATGSTQSIEIPSCRKVRVEISAVDLGDCDDEGTRPVRMTSVVVPADTEEEVEVQWLVDGAVVVDRAAIGSAVGRVTGDGEVHTVEVRVLRPEGASGDQERIEIPHCERSRSAEIVSVEVGETCNDDGTRTVTLISRVECDADRILVQWRWNDQVLTEEIEPGETEIRLRGDGEAHDLVLEVIEPEDFEPVTQALEIPVCCVHVDQSDVIHLEAVGSDGSDSTVPGAHLRWQLVGELGDHHLPKGHGASAAAVGFSRPEDFVTIEKYPYVPAPLELDVATLMAGQPVEVLGAGGPRTITLVAQGAQRRLSVDNEAFFAFSLDTSPGTSVRLEVLGTRAGKEMVILRKTVWGSFSAEVDNATALLLDLSAGALTAVTIETYSDFYAAALQAAATKAPEEGEPGSSTDGAVLARYALSLDDAEVEARLANPSISAVEAWPKFDGAGIVVENYLSRWRGIAPDDAGLRSHVESYLELSETDTAAVATLESDEPGDLHTTSLSLLDALNLVALDFHLARMLGLATIDPFDASTSERYIYCARYTAPAAPDVQVGSQAGDPEHRYFSLPTGVDDSRLPPPPVLEPVTYGLSVPASTGAYPLTDSDGYSVWTPVRYVNLHADADPVRPRNEGFFETPHEFDRSSTTERVLLGASYRKQGDPGWRPPGRPEEREPPGPETDPAGLPGEADHLDAEGYPEPISMLPASEAAPGAAFFSHEEVEEGPHEYAAYAINWFSRRSADSASVVTDATQFDVPCRALAPGPVTSHLIQPEAPLVLTSAAEQASRVGQIRVNFGWGPSQVGACSGADTISFRWRKEPIMVVGGRITSVVDVGAGDEADVVLGPVPLLSAGDSTQALVPEILPAQANLFIGAHLATESGAFEIVGVTATPTGAMPSLRVRKVRTAEADAGLGPSGGLLESFARPKVGELGSVAENLEADGNPNWTPLSETFTIDLAGAVMEGSATVSGVDPIAGQPLAPGLFAISVTSPSAPPSHPMLEWAGGAVAAPTPSGEIVTVEVLRLGMDGSTLHAVVRSPEALASGPQTVTLYPGYRAYLPVGPGLGVTEADLSPVAPSTIATTYLSVVASASATGCRSPGSPPSQIHAIRTTTPLAPKAPAGPGWATRPAPLDGKSSYTFDAEFETTGAGGPRSVYGFVVERASLSGLLAALYAPASMAAVRTLLGSPSSNAHWSDALRELCDVDDATSGFTAFGGAALPVPDNPESPHSPAPLNGQAPASASLDGVSFNGAIVNAAVATAFLPVTSSPVVARHVRDGEQTSSGPPVVHDAAGKAMEPTDPGFDPTPMVRRTAAGPYRFTDFTLDGAADEVFFYRVREVSENLASGDPSPTLGPIRLVNTRPPAAPSVASTLVRRADAANHVAAAVVFDLVPPSATDQVSHVRIYRSFDEDDVAAVQAMDEAATVTLPPRDGSVPAPDQIVDEFTDLAAAPAGRPLFYRLVACRQIENEHGGSELVLSPPTTVLRATLPDLVIPMAPEIESTRTPASGTDAFTLTWQPVVAWGRYELSVLRSSGRWEVVHVVESDQPMAYPPDGDFATHAETASLAAVDAAGSPVFHRFKVEVRTPAGRTCATPSVHRIPKP